VHSTIRYPPHVETIEGPRQNLTDRPGDTEPEADRLPVRRDGMLRFVDVDIEPMLAGHGAPREPLVGWAVEPKLDG
jgi:hypothetical protein